MKSGKENGQGQKEWGWEDELNQPLISLSDFYVLCFALLDFFLLFLISPLIFSHGVTSITCVYVGRMDVKTAWAFLIMFSKMNVALQLAERNYALRSSMLTLELFCLGLLL